MSDTIQDTANLFLENLFSQLNSHQISLEKHWQIDHLCFRTSSLKKYEHYKVEFATIGTLLVESEVNGRPISTFKLNQALHFKDWVIDLIELPAPKAEKPSEDGFEHAEVVCDVPFEEIQKRFAGNTFSTKGVKKLINPEIEIELKKCAIKFHHSSLESVINLEKNDKVMAILRTCGVLEKLNKHHPLIAGAYPLAIDSENAEINILVSSSSLENLKQELQKDFSEFTGFRIHESTIQNSKSLIANFFFDGIKFEIAAQNAPAIRQVAYLQFLAQEKLLKLGSPHFRDIVKKNHRGGAKIDLAFSRALALSGDAYEQMVALQKMGDFELLKMLSKV
jgi:predicted metalloenzyme YecM